MAELAVVDRTHAVTNFGSACYWAGVDASDRAGWLDARRNHLTASDLPAVLGYTRFKSPLEVYLEKVEPTEQAPLTIYDRAFWGTVFERPILDAIAPHYGWKILNYGGALLVSRDSPDLACTLDAELRIEGADVPYEGKTTQEWLHKEWDEDEQKAPTRVLLQVQGQQRVTLAPRTETFCLVGGGSPVLVHVEPNSDVQSLIAETSRTFMKAVRERQQPQANENDDDLLRRMYPGERPGSVVKLDASVADWAQRIDDIAADREALKREADALKNRLKQLIGDAEYGVYKSGDTTFGCYRWKNEAKGSRVLRRITGEKSMPRINKALFELMEAARPRELVDDLQASLERASRHAEVKSLPKPKRRQARR